MNILHISLGLPPYRTGGLTKYSIDLITAQKELSHKVSILYPGHYNSKRSLSIEKRKAYFEIDVYELVNPVPVPLLGGIKTPFLFMTESNKDSYHKFLSEIKPDIIHLHTLMGIHKEFLEAAKELEIKTVFTTHDYYGICPKVNLFDSLGHSCADFEAGTKCIDCNKNGYSLLKIMVMQSRTYRHFKNSFFVKKLRKYEKNRSTGIVQSANYNAKFESNNAILAKEYVNLREYFLRMFSLIDTFHFNSSITKQEYEKYMDVKGEVISITHQDILDQRRQKDYSDLTQPLRIGYLGPTEIYKGFYMLKESLDNMIGNRNWELHVYGDSMPVGHEFDPDYYTLHGRYDHSELKKIFDFVDLIIVPSICKETFGFIGLEALSHGVPVILSEFAGVQDIVQHRMTGIIVKPDANSLKEVIEEVLNDREILSKMNRNILDMDFPYTMNRHVKEIIGLYNETQDKSKVMS